jgi:hypothetical protein
MSWQDEISSMSEDQIEENILAIIATADTALIDEAQRQSAWYIEVNAFAVGIANGYGISVAQACGIIAAYSSNTTWKGNQTIVKRVMESGAYGLPDAVKKTNLILAMDPDHDIYDVMRILNGPKISRFALNIFDPYSDEVTVDRWMVRAAMNNCDKKIGLPPTESVRIKIQNVIKRIAKRMKLACAAAQAFVWTIIRGSGE